MSPQRLDADDFTTVKRLAESTAGAMNDGIYLVRQRSSNRLYIEKRAGPQSIRLGYTMREIEAMAQMSHFPNIIRLKDFDVLSYKCSGYGSIWMQYCELGSLDSLVKRFRERGRYLADEGFLWKVLWDLSCAMAHMFSGQSPKVIRECAMSWKCVPVKQGWNMRIHRDIKLANVFLTEKRYPGTYSPYPTVILGDWGCNTSFEDVVDQRANLGCFSAWTPAWAPPEAPNCNTASDTYQVGLIIHCLSHMCYAPAEEKRVPAYPLAPRYKSRELRDLVEACLEKDVKRRPSPKNLPWMIVRASREWKRGRRVQGEELPKWAVGLEN